MSDDYERVKTWCNDPRKMPCAPYNSICRVFEDYDRLRTELSGKEKALSAAKTVIEAKDKAYALIDQRFAAMAAKAATTDSERECNERLTAEIDALTAELADVRADRDRYSDLLDVSQGCVRELRRLLDEARKQEPVATLVWSDGGDDVVFEEFAHTFNGMKLYAAPVPAQPAVPDDVAKDAARYRWLRGNRFNSLHITHNDHRSNYCTAKEWIEDYSHDWFSDEPEHEVDKMKAADSIWCVQIYPSTPIGFIAVNRAGLDDAIDAAILSATEGRSNG